MVKFLNVLVVKYLVPFVRIDFVAKIKSIKWFIRRFIVAGLTLRFYFYGLILSVVRYGIMTHRAH